MLQVLCCVGGPGRRARNESYPVNRSLLASAARAPGWSPWIRPFTFLTSAATSVGNVVLMAASCAAGINKGLSTRRGQRHGGGVP